MRQKLSILIWLVMLPLIGPVITKQNFGQYLEFPPKTQYITHAPFSWLAFIVIASGISVVCLPVIQRWLRLSKRAQMTNPSMSSFPWWGWTGLFAGIVSWILAWTRFPWFASFQFLTFIPLWFSFIIVINAWTWKRSKHCMLIDKPIYFFKLFVLSAVFWWFFEYLNRFVQNWHYIGVENMSSLKYFVFATLSFSTVLPAVLGTYELLKTFPRFNTGLTNFTPLPFLFSKCLAAITFCIASLSLICMAIWPNYLFFILWLSPMLIMMSYQILRGEHTLLAGLATGNWQNTFLWAFAALICGFFWEMWNILSMAKWIYSVPFVQRFPIFEMPVLGYAGYLPFGLECAIVVDFMLYSKRYSYRIKGESLSKTIVKNRRAESH